MSCPVGDDDFKGFPCPPCDPPPERFRCDPDEPLPEPTVPSGELGPEEPEFTEVVFALEPPVEPEPEEPLPEIPEPAVPADLPLDEMVDAVEEEADPFRIVRAAEGVLTAIQRVITALETRVGLVGRGVTSDMADVNRYLRSVVTAVANAVGQMNAQLLAGLEFQAAQRMRSLLDIMRGMALSLGAGAPGQIATIPPIRPSPAPAGRPAPAPLPRPEVQVPFPAPPPGVVAVPFPPPAPPVTPPILPPGVPAVAPAPPEVAVPPPVPPPAPPGPPVAPSVAPPETPPAAPPDFCPVPRPDPRQEISEDQQTCPS